MNRRQFLSGVGAGSLLLAGCLSRGSSDSLVYSAENPVIAGPTVTDNTAYFTVRDGVLYSDGKAGSFFGVDLSSGRLTTTVSDVIEYPNWDNETPNQSTRPVVDDRDVFIGGRAPAAFTLDGERLWRIDFTDRFKAQASLRPPVVAGETVYFGLSTGAVCALHRETGEVPWTTSVGTAGVSGWTLLGNSLIAVDPSGVIALLDRDSGEVRRQRTFKSASEGGPFTIGSVPHVVNEEIYVAGNGIVSRFDSGLQRVWGQSLPLAWSVPPVITDTSYYAIGEKPMDSTAYLYKLSRESGRVEWEQSLSATLGGGQTVSFGNRLYTLGKNGARLLVATLDGNLAFEIPFESPVTGLAAFDDSLVVLTSHGRLFELS